MRSNWTVNPNSDCDGFKILCEGERAVAYVIDAVLAERIARAMNACEYAATMMGAVTQPEPQ